jgi:hypothetical protein
MNHDVRSEYTKLLISPVLTIIIKKYFPGELRQSNDWLASYSTWLCKKGIRNDERASELVSASVLVETDCHCARPFRMGLFPIVSRECEQFMTRKDAKMISDTHLNHEEHTTNHTIDFYLFLHTY